MGNSSIDRDLFHCLFRADHCVVDRAAAETCVDWTRRCSLNRKPRLCPASGTRQGLHARCYRPQVGKSRQYVIGRLHLGPSILLAQGVADSVVAKVTGHRSAALRGYQHLSDSFRKQTVDLIATVLITQTPDTRTDTPSNPALEDALPQGCKSKRSKGLHGRPVGTRTPDLYRVKVAL